MQINTAELKNKLQILGMAYSSKPYIAELSFLKFYDGALTMSNGSDVVYTNIEYQGEPINTLLPYDMLNKIIGRVTGDVCEFTLVGQQIKFKCGRSNFKLNPGDITKYPVFANIGGTNTSVDVDTLRNIVTKISVAVDSPSKKPILSGINFSGGNACGTNSYKLIKMPGIEGVTATIEKNSLVRLVNNLPLAGNVEITYNTNSIIFVTPDFTYQTRLLDGNYPVVDKLYPTDFVCACTAAKSDLLETLNRMSIMGPEAIIKITVSGELMTIYCQSATYGETYEQLELTNVSGEIELLCQLKNITDLISQAPDQIEFKFAGAERPFTICGNMLTLPVRGQ